MGPRAQVHQSQPPISDLQIQLLARALGGYSLGGYSLGGYSSGGYSPAIPPISDLGIQLLASALGSYSLGGYSPAKPTDFRSGCSATSKCSGPLSIWSLKESSGEHNRLIFTQAIDRVMELGQAREGDLAFRCQMTKRGRLNIRLKGKTSQRKDRRVLLGQQSTLFLAEVDDFLKDFSESQLDCDRTCVQNEG